MLCLVPAGNRDTALQVVLGVTVFAPVVPFGAKVEVIAVLIHAEYIAECVMAT